MNFAKFLRTPFFAERLQSVLIFVKRNSLKKSKQKALKF